MCNWMLSLAWPCIKRCCLLRQELSPDSVIVEKRHSQTTEPMHTAHTRLTSEEGQNCLEGKLWFYCGEPSYHIDQCLTWPTSGETQQHGQCTVKECAKPFCITVVVHHSGTMFSLTALITTSPKVLYLLIVYTDHKNLEYLKTEKHQVNSDGPCSSPGLNSRSLMSQVPKILKQLHYNTLTHHISDPHIQTAYCVNLVISVLMVGTLTDRWARPFKLTLLLPSVPQLRVISNRYE